VKDWTICELVVELNRWVNAEESTFMRAPYARAVPRPPHLPMSAGVYRHPIHKPIAKLVDQLNR
jgi:hypothetical protein